MTPQEALENLKRIILIQTLNKFKQNKQKVKKNVMEFSSKTLPYKISMKYQILLCKIHTVKHNYEV